MPCLTSPHLTSPLNSHRYFLFTHLIVMTHESVVLSLVLAKPIAWNKHTNTKWPMKMFDLNIRITILAISCDYNITFRQTIIIIIIQHCWDDFIGQFSALNSFSIKTFRSYKIHIMIFNSILAIIIKIRYIFYSMAHWLH